MQISIVVPLYNEEESLHELYDWIKKVMTANNLSYEVIFVDDGSTDGSWKIISDIVAAEDNAIGVKFRRNYGKSNCQKIIPAVTATGRFASVQLSLYSNSQTSHIIKTSGELSEE